MKKESKADRFNHVSISEKVDLGLPKTRQVLDAMVEILTEMPVDAKLAIPGLGVFTKKKTKARKARNPKTGETIKVEPKIKIAFKVSKDLRSL